MGKRPSYPPGTFSWLDLATTDAVAAKAFYTGLFGWEADSYVTVEDADAVVARVRSPAQRLLSR